MANFTQRLTQRVQHTGISKGYCLICGSHGPLSWDHVPPKGSITVTAVEQMHIMEYLHESKSEIKSIASPNGSKFKTICLNCNGNILGRFDQEICKVFRDITDKVKRFYLGSHNYSPSSSFFAEVDAVSFLKAMVGHVLSATTTQDCLDTQVSSPYFTPLKDFVLGKIDNISDTHEFYCWFYPYSYHLSVKGFGLKNRGHFGYMSLLSFFPLAFLVAEKGKGIYPAHAKKIEISDQFIVVNMSQENAKFSRFPFVELKGDQMMVLRDCDAIISYPKLD